jgi:hypothetical protein
MRAPLCLAVPLAILLAMGTARADIGVVVTGEATLQPALIAQLQDWLKVRGHTVQLAALEPDAINTLVDCFVIEDLGCATKVIEQRSKVQTIVFARVESTPNESGSRDIALVGHWLQKGHETISERRVCQQCNSEKLRATVEDLMLALAAEPPTSSHVPSANKAEHAASPPAPDSDRPSRLVPAAVIGGGLALAITGGVLIAIDQNPSPTGVQAATYRDSAAAGWVFAGLGAAAIGTGIYLWFRQDSHSAPVATVSHDGAVVGWTGRF